MALERRSVVYEGRVQGVGFRYTAYRLASGAGVSGLVRNLADGSVELEVQGETERVADFLRAVREAFGAKIRLAVEASIPPDVDEAAGDFRILD